jgi:hypothetical protein
MAGQLGLGHPRRRIRDDCSRAIRGHAEPHRCANGQLGGIYQAVETVSGVTESLVVGVGRPDGGCMPLFVSLAPGALANDRPRSAVRTAIREGVSKPHLPDDIIQIDAVPNMLTGKKLRYPSNASCSVNTGPTSSISVPSERPDVLAKIADLAATMSPV